MKREELYSFGIDESHRKDFLAVYWKDVRKAADQMIQKKKRKTEGDPSPEELREAIGCMVKLIPDPVRLQRVLTYVNTQYHKMRLELEEMSRQEDAEQGEETAPTVDPLPDQEPEGGTAENVCED